jgi:hypothetical protein
VRDGWEGSVEVVVLIKAAPETGRKHGEQVCVAGIDAWSRWHRLYPVPWRDLRPEQRFKRWDVVRAVWRRPGDDDRVESRRIDHESIEVLREVPERERHAIINRAIVPNLDLELGHGRSLALIRPENLRFRVTRLNDRELRKVQRRRDELVRQPDFFAATALAREAAPYSFTYDFDYAGKRRSYSCLDWEIEATFFKWRRHYGEEDALQKMRQTWGEKLPAAGVALALGTHRVRHWRRWLLTGIIRADRLSQAALDL